MSAADANSLGQVLRQQRLRKEMDLGAVATKTKICPSILDAIERDRFDRIPGGAYRRHFIRQYACYLGMDGDAAVAAFREQYVEPPLPLPIPPKTRRPRWWADLAWAVVLAAVAVSGYKYSQARHHGTNPLERIWSWAELRASEQPRGTASRELPERPDTPLQNPSRLAAPPTPESTPQAARAPVHVAFTATEPVWVSVKCDGNASYAGVMEVPQSKTFDAAATVTALIGNAGGLLVSLNGNPIGQLGGHGEVQAIELTLKGARHISREAAFGNSPAVVPRF